MSMPVEPTKKRTIAFVEGQNLFHNLRAVFGHTYPNYDVQKPASAICSNYGWELERVQFYKGVPSRADDPFWHGFWANKLAMMGRHGVVVYNRTLVYRTRTVHLPGLGGHTIRTGEEKGIDVRLALDALDGAHRNMYDVALIFSQDQDLSELAALVRQVARFQKRWIKIASAYADSATAANRRGINNTDWCPFDKRTYDTCIDPRDYRPKSNPQPGTP
jgi:hypothetical protein